MLTDEMASPPQALAEAPAPTSVAITIQLVVLAVAFVIGRALERIRFQWMGEAGAALLLGLVVGLVLRGAGVGQRLAEAVAFKGGIFFYILLPTIMFDAGYSLDTRMFIKNVGSVCLYAFAGTTISCFVVGLMMWSFGVWGWCYRMPLLANLTFGALISATDPVTVLAVFQRLGAQPDLYMNVFGESVLNDAVGMVLYNVIAEFLGGKAVNAGSVFAGIGLFFAIFLGSTAIGLVIGLLAAFIFRSRYFYSGPVYVEDAGGEPGRAEAGGGNSTFEVGLAVVFAYGSYLVADAAHCSGIVAVVVNGMVMSMYVKPNLSTEAAHKIETLFKTLASLFELFVFCYIGSTMFLVDEEFNILGYTLLSLIALAVSRAANILPCSALVNALRPPERHIPPRAQFLMWWAGLRGAMAFALSVEASDKFGDYGKVMKTCTFYLIFITVLVNGGTSSHLLHRLKLRAEDTPALLSHMSTEGEGGWVPWEGRGGFGSEDVAAAAALRRRGEEEQEEKEEEGTPFNVNSSRSSDGIGITIGSGAGGGGGLSSSRSLLRSPSSLLARVRSMNDGRLVDRFDKFDRAVSKLLIHPDARREAELVRQHGGSGSGAAGPGDISAHGSPSHGHPQVLQTLTPTPSPPPGTRSMSMSTQLLSPPAAAASSVAGGGGGGAVGDGLFGFTPNVYLAPTNGAGDAGGATSRRRSESGR